MQFPRFTSEIPLKFAAQHERERVNVEATFIFSLNK